VSIEATHVSGTWWRHTPAGAEVLGQPADAPDMRWQHGEIVEGLYLADSPETVWAEWYRWLAEADSRRCARSLAISGDGRSPFHGSRICQPRSGSKRSVSGSPGQVGAIGLIFSLRATGSMRTGGPPSSLHRQPERGDSSCVYSAK
jgi:hypothetical protein